MSCCIKTNRTVCNYQKWKQCVLNTCLKMHCTRERLHWTCRIKGTAPGHPVWLTAQSGSSATCTYRRNVEEGSPNHCFSGKAISVTYSECVSVALGIQCAMRPYFTFFLSCLILHYLYTLSRRRYDFRNKFVWHGMCVLIFSTRSVWKKKYSHYENNLVIYY